MHSSCQTEPVWLKFSCGAAELDGNDNENVGTIADRLQSDSRI